MLIAMPTQFFILTFLNDTITFWSVEAVLASTSYTFRELEQNIKAIFPWCISRTTVHNLCNKVADASVAEEENGVKALYEDGVIPGGKGKVVPYLFAEADGVNVSLQREEERGSEVKVGIAHEAWREIAKGGYNGSSSPETAIADSLL